MEQLCHAEKLYEWNYYTSCTRQWKTELYFKEISQQNKELVTVNSIFKIYEINISAFELKKTKLLGFDPRANYTDRASAACWRR
jgi:hypothetical protein